MSITEYLAVTSPQLIGRWLWLTVDGVIQLCLVRGIRPFTTTARTAASERESRFTLFEVTTAAGMDRLVLSRDSEIALTDDQPRTRGLLGFIAKPATVIETRWRHIAAGLFVLVVLLACGVLVITSARHLDLISEASADALLLYLLTLATVVTALCLFAATVALAETVAAWRRLRNAVRATVQSVGAGATTSAAVKPAGNRVRTGGR